MNPIIQKIMGEATGFAGTVDFKAPPEPPPEGALRNPVAAVTGAPSAHAAEERRETAIGREILAALDQMMPLTRRDRMVQRVEQLAKELIQMHGV